MKSSGASVRSPGDVSSVRWRRAFGAGYVVFTVAAFPHPIGEAVIDLGWALAWLSPAFLILSLRGLDVRRAAWAAFLTTWLAHALLYHWFYVVTVTYGHAPVVFGLLAPLGAALYPAAFGALFGASFAWLSGRELGTPLVAALLWTAADHLRHFALGGFPWAVIGYAQHRNPLLLPLASVTGVYGLSFATVLLGAAVAASVDAGTRGRPVPRAAWVSALGVASLLGLGVWLGSVALDAPGAGEGPGAGALRDVARIAAVQGNVDQGSKWTRERYVETLVLYEALSRRAAAEGARIIAWPETAMPGALEVEEAAASRVRQLARETQAALVVGSVGVELSEDRRRIERFYDSAFAFARDGGMVERYDKSHLVPFGEYVPLRWLLGHVLSAVARGIAPMDVSAGPGPTAFVLGDTVTGEGGVRVGVPICYELLFPAEVRGFVADGARVLLAITNDAWYGRTGAPHQFLAITAVRAAETGTWIVRAANTGVSAFIDGRGRVRERSDIFEQDVLVADVPLLPLEGGRSFYVRHGDVFVRLCWLGLVAVFGWAALGRSRRAASG